jgi:hypothetical protein
MIDAAVVRDAARIRESFQQAKPFRHVMIEGFLERDAADALLRDFPRFDERKAINEHGDVGRKAVVEHVTAVSRFYAKFYDYINSKPFLAAMSELTGIPDLIADTTLFGGGTHENLDGQGLDVHVDFNVDERRMLHRRVNLLIYLNHEWDAAWGGAIELHSNPWYPEADEVKSFLPLFNHGLIFETNEYSWHGCRRIALPPERKDLSRKSFSIYLYTRDRPADEIVAPHTTFYVPQPIPDTVTAGATLSERDAQEIRIAMQSRDGLIRMYQKLLVDKEQRLRELIRVRQQLGTGASDYDVILGSRSWRLVMALHRARYRVHSALRRIGRGVR